MARSDRQTSPRSRRGPAPGHGAADNEYARLAPDYDHRWRTYVAASVEQTLLHLNPEPGQCLLDLGSGTGVLLRSLSARAPGVTLVGLDRSLPMLSRARSRELPGLGVVAGSAEQLPFADQTFDWVVSSSVFHYLRQAGAALAEVRRVLRPRGRLVITDWCRDFLTMQLLDTWLKWTNRGHFRTLTARELTGCLDQAGFDQIQCRRYRISRVWGLMTAEARRAPGP